MTVENSDIEASATAITSANWRPQYQRKQPWSKILKTKKPLLSALSSPETHISDETSSFISSSKEQIAKHNKVHAQYSWTVCFNN